MKKNVTVSMVRSTWPSVRLVDAQPPGGKGKMCEMLEVSYTEVLQTSVEDMPFFDEGTFRLPPNDEICPPLSLVFATKQPMMPDGGIFIEHNLTQAYNDGLLKELGIPRISPNALLQPAIISLVAGTYEKRGKKQRLFLDRFDQATHVIVQVYWLEGFRPQAHGLGCHFAQKNGALAFHRVGNTTRHCGSDFWLLTLQRDSAIYRLLQKIDQQDEKMLEEVDLAVRTRVACQQVIEQMFVDKGVVEAVAQLPGWRLRFGEEKIFLYCVDNAKYEALLALDYSTGNLAVVQDMVKLYQDGCLRLAQVLSIDEYLS